VNVLKDKTTTITSLEKLKLVTTIVFLISCRKGYLTDLGKRGINQLHNAMSQLVLPNNLKLQIIPAAGKFINRKMRIGVLIYIIY
jgi:hypothetical protein